MPQKPVRHRSVLSAEQSLLSLRQRLQAAGANDVELIDGSREVIRSSFDLLKKTEHLPRKRPESRDVNESN